MIQRKQLTILFSQTLNFSLEWELIKASYSKEESGLKNQNLNLKNHIKTAKNFNPNGNGKTKFYDGPRIENFEENDYFTRVLVREKDKDYPLKFSKTRISKDELKLVFEDEKDGWNM